MPKSTKAPGGTQRRESSVFRARCQEAYEKLKELISAHGATDIAKDLEGHDTIEDVMRAKPEMVGALLNSAWKLRTHADISTYFQDADKDGTVVSEYDQSIGPCRRTFDDTIQAHLYGATRLYLKLRETEWVRVQLAQPEKLDKALSPGLGNSVRSLLGMKLKVNEDLLRETYPGRGLYEILKPLLLDEAQFKLITGYAELSTERATSIGDILDNLRSIVPIRIASLLDPGALKVARSCAVAYAAAEVSEEKIPDDEALNTDSNQDGNQQDSAENVKQRAAIVFADILSNHIDIIVCVGRHKAGAEAIVKALAPLFREDTWSVLSDESAVENVMNCPSTVRSLLGRESRYVAVEISKYINQLEYPDIGRDIIRILQMELQEKSLVRRVLHEEASVGVWKTVPEMFNEKMKYQHDASGEDDSIKNFEDLRITAAALIKEYKKALGLSND